MRVAAARELGPPPPVEVGRCGTVEWVDGDGVAVVCFDGETRRLHGVKPGDRYQLRKLRAEEGAEEDAEAVLRAGARVEAAGLSGAAGLNGLRGTVLAPQGDRWRVRFDSPAAGEKALRPSNLRAITEEETEGK
eukprot:gene5153-2745_t